MRWASTDSKEVLELVFKCNGMKFFRYLGPKDKMLVLTTKFIECPNWSNSIYPIGNSFFLIEQYLYL